MVPSDGARHETWRTGDQRREAYARQLPGDYQRGQPGSARVRGCLEATELKAQVRSSVTLLEAHARDQEQIVTVTLYAELSELGGDREVFAYREQHAGAQGRELWRGHLDAVPTDGRLDALPGDLPRIAAPVAPILAQEIKHVRKPCD